MLALKSKYSLYGIILPVKYLCLYTNQIKKTFLNFNLLRYNVMQDHLIIHIRLFSDSA